MDGDTLLPILFIRSSTTLICLPWLFIWHFLVLFWNLCRVKLSSMDPILPVYLNKNNISSCTQTKKNVENPCTHKICQKIIITIHMKMVGWCVPIIFITCFYPSIPLEWDILARKQRNQTKIANTFWLLASLENRQHMMMTVSPIWLRKCWLSYWQGLKNKDKRKQNKNWQRK